MDPINDDSQQPLVKPQKSQLFQKVFFFALGVSSLSGWNAILTGLSYFSAQYPDRDVYFILPIPNFISLCLIGLFLPRLSSLLSMQFRIVWALVITCVLLFLLPLVAMLNHGTLGYYSCLIIIFLMGIFSSLQQNSSVGMSGILGPDYINVFFIGTGASGTIITIFRMISLAAIESDNQKAIYLYIGIAVLWNIGTISMYFMFAKTPQYRKIIQAHKKGRKSVLVHDQIITQEENDNQESIVSATDMTESQEPKQLTQSIENMNVFQTLFWINKVAFPIPILIILLYIQTFMMFPGVAFNKHFNQDFIDWGQCLISLGYNIGDTVGKYLAGNRKLISLNILLVLFTIRFAFFYFYIELALDNWSANWISYVNTLLYGTFNGFITTGYMILGPEKSNEGFVKEKIGFINGFSLCLGIMLGTFLALPFAKIGQ